MSSRIRDMEPNQRPRERLRRDGSKALSEAELLAVLLRVGRPGRSAVDEAHDLLAAMDGLVGVARMSPRELERRPGIGPAKAAAICAALELGRRVARVDVPDVALLERPEVAGDYLVARLRGQRREVFGFLSLDAGHRLLQDHELWVGTRLQAPVEPAEVFRTALLDDAAGIIVFHNHPSGRLEPSRDDLELTGRLVCCGDTLGISVLDHLVIAGSQWLSLRASRPDLFRRTHGG
jgi:DNA repair protein RadC